LAAAAWDADGLLSHAHLLFEQMVKMKSDLLTLFNSMRWRRSRIDRAILLESYAIQNSKCASGVAYRGGASFISALELDRSWTETVGLPEVVCLYGKSEMSFCQKTPCELTRTIGTRLQEGVTHRGTFVTVDLIFLSCMVNSAVLAAKQPLAGTSRGHNLDFSADRTAEKVSSMRRVPF